VQGMGDMIKALASQVRTVAEGEEIFPASTSGSPRATARGTPPTSSTRAGSG